MVESPDGPASGAGKQRTDGVSGKAPRAMLTIGEVAEALDIKPHILRYWEAQFDMLSPLKRAGGRRYYRSEDVVLLREIDRLVNRQGYTLRGARQYLRDRQLGGEPLEAEVAAPKDNAALSPAVAQELRALRTMMQSALDRS